MLRSLLIIAAGVFPTLLAAQNSGNFFNLSIDSLTAGKIKTQTFVGKGTVIWLADANSQSPKAIKQLDSLALANKATLQVMVIPCADCSALPPDTALARLYATNSRHLQVAAPGFSKKANGEKQHKLLKWMSNKGDNKHFDFDYKSGQTHLFVVAPNGRLVAHFEQFSNFSAPILNRVFAKLK